MDVKEPDLSGSYTYADYLTWTWDELTELIDGRIFKMSPAPGSRHQDISGNLFILLRIYFHGRKCKVFSAPFDVRLPDKSIEDQDIVNVVQPDLCVICDLTKIDERGCLGPPDWVIEILSPRTSAKDLNEKFYLYEKSGVREYWVVHPHEQTVLIYTLDEKGKYQGNLKPFIISDRISPGIFPDLQIDLEKVFAES
jgi:Uma2 family endonuclease